MRGEVNTNAKHLASENAEDKDRAWLLKYAQHHSTMLRKQKKLGKFYKLREKEDRVADAKDMEERRQNWDNAEHIWEEMSEAQICLNCRPPHSQIKEV